MPCGSFSYLLVTSMFIIQPSINPRSMTVSRPEMDSLPFWIEFPWIDPAILAEKLCPGRVDRVDNTCACLTTVPKMDLLDLDGLTDLTEIKKIEFLWNFPEMTSKNLVWGSQISGNAHLYHLGPICWPSTRPRPVRLQSLLVKVTGPNPKP